MKTDRQYSCKWFARFLQKLFSTSGEIDFQFRVIVTVGEEEAGNYGEWLTMNVDYDMRFSTRDLFSDSAHRLIVEQWKRDLEKQDITWISGNFRKPTLPEFLSFCFDPEHRKEIEQLLRPNALCLLTQLASLLDDKLSDMGSHYDEFEVSRHKRKPSAVLLEQKRIVAERLWQSKESFLTKNLLRSHLTILYLQLHQKNTFSNS